MITDAAEFIWVVDAKRSADRVERLKVTKITVKQIKATGGWYGYERTFRRSDDSIHASLDAAKAQAVGLIARRIVRLSERIERSNASIDRIQAMQESGS